MSSFAIWGSAGFLEISMNGHSAAESATRKARRHDNDESYVQDFRDSQDRSLMSFQLLHILRSCLKEIFLAYCAFAAASFGTVDDM